MHPALVLSIFLAPLTSALRSSGNGELAQPERPAKRVAIIGAGAAGSSTAYHLAEYASTAGIPLNVTVFERNSYVGGRTTTVNAWSAPSTPVELGGSIFVEVNHILVAAARRFNLSTSSHDTPTPAGAPDLGVWNGREFVLITQSEDGWWEKAKLLWRYGLAPLKVNRMMTETVGKFLQLYSEPIFPFKSLSDAIEELELTATTSHTGEQLLKAGGVGDKFAHEIVQASTRVNYASNLGLIHGLETMVCIAISGARAVTGGNWQIFQSMLNSSSSISTRLNTTIGKVSKQSDDSYTLETSSGETPSYDTVVLAAPHQFASLTIDPPAQYKTPDSIPYVKLHVTLFASPYELSPLAFNLPPGQKLPQYILTTLPPEESHGSDPNGVGTPGFFSISIVDHARNPTSNPPDRPEYIYKIFTPTRVPSSRLAELLGQNVDDQDEGTPNGAVTWVHRKVWDSYPYEYPRVTFDESKLDEGLWYTSGIEAFISTMETSALMGKNIAKLIVDEWAGEKKGAHAMEELEVQSGKDEWEFQGVGVEGDRPELKAKL